MIEAEGESSSHHVERRNWQISLRSLLIFVSMAAATFGWWRLIGFSSFPSWPSYWHWRSWLTIGTIALPYVWVIAGAAIPARWHIAQWLKFWVVVLGLNTTWGFYRCLHIISVESLGMLDPLLREEFTNEFSTTFALPVVLGMLAVLSVPRPHRRLGFSDWGFVFLVICNVTLIYWAIPFVFENAWAE